MIASKKSAAIQAKCDHQITHEGRLFPGKEGRCIKCGATFYFTNQDPYGERTPRKSKKQRRKEKAAAK